MSPLSFDNVWTDRNADCCVKTVDEKLTMATNVVNFGPENPAILLLGGCTRSQNTLFAGF